MVLFFLPPHGAVPSIPIPSLLCHSPSIHYADAFHSKSQEMNKGIQASLERKTEAETKNNTTVITSHPLSSSLSHYQAVRMGASSRQD